MTLNLLTQTSEGLVMLSDSMVSSQRVVDGELLSISFEHARKLFHLGEDLPVAAMMNGNASIGSIPISQLLRGASRAVDDRHKAQSAQGTGLASSPPSDVAVDHDSCIDAIKNHISPTYDRYVVQLKKEAADRLASEPDSLVRINKDRAVAKQPPISSITPDMIAVTGVEQPGPVVKEIDPPEFTIIVGSYFDTPLASTMSWPGAVRSDLVIAQGGTVWWWGSGATPLIRLIKGVDIYQLASDDKGHAAAVALKYFEDNAERFDVDLALDIMPVQQAIYFSEYLATVAAGYDRFKVGPKEVGGEIDVLVLVDGKLKWIHKQRLTSSLAALTTSSG
jgi:hypothetical protein